MGFRTLAMSEACWIELPAWFVEKYQGAMHFGDRDGKPSLPIVTKFERKFYANKEDALFTDFQRVLKELPDTYRFRDEDGVEFVLFHECGGITKVKVGGSFIRMCEPSRGWEEVEGITHHYCYECSKP
jgi:hypothetical protein